MTCNMLLHTHVQITSIKYHCDGWEWSGQFYYVFIVHRRFLNDQLTLCNGFPLLSAVSQSSRTITALSKSPVHVVSQVENRIKASLMSWGYEAIIIIRRYCSEASQMLAVRRWKEAVCCSCVGHAGTLIDYANIRIISVIRLANYYNKLCFSLRNEHHSKPAAPNLQHTTNWEQRRPMW